MNKYSVFSIESNNVIFFVCFSVFLVAGYISLSILEILEQKLVKKAGRNQLIHLINSIRVTNKLAKKSGLLTVTFFDIIYTVKI